MKHIFYCLLCMSIISFTSCKKKTIDQPDSGINTIYYTQKTLTLSHFTNPTTLNVDLDTNGSVDMVFLLHYGYSSPSSYQYFGSVTMNGGSLLSIQPIAPPVNEMIRIYPQGAIMDTLNSIWEPYNFLYHKAEIAGSIIPEDRIVTMGDVYIAFKLLKNGDYHFGWMKINCNPNYQAIQIKEWAFETKPNTTIQIGQTKTN